MDANRNEALYSRAGNDIVANFVGDSDWRTRRSSGRLNFGDFVVDEFGKSMARIGYHYDGLSDMQLIRSTEKNLPLYYLGFFSKHPLGSKFWEQCRKYTNPQRTLF
jgi:hypothetical protein